MKRKDRVFELVLCALMTSLVTVATMVIKIPIPMGGGYVHFGDAMIVLSVAVLGRNRGAAASALGSRLADVLGGFVSYAPLTLIIKFFTAFILGCFLRHGQDRGGRLYRLAGFVLAGIEMTAGYALADMLLLSSPAAALAGMPFNAAQFAVGAVLGLICVTALDKTLVKRLFYSKSHSRKSSCRNTRQL